MDYIERLPPGISAKDLKISPLRIVKRLKMPANAGFEFVRSWDLTKLVYWALLDPVASREEASCAGEGGSSRRPKIRSTSARLAGQVALLWFMDRTHHGHHAEENRLANFGSLTSAFALFNAAGGVPVVVDYPSLRLTDELRLISKQRDLFLTYAITDNLVRAVTVDPSKAKIKAATRCAANLFVLRNRQLIFVPENGDLIDLNLDGMSVSKSLAEKTWSEYKRSAPYIYAFYPIYRRYMLKIDAHYDLMRLIEKLTKKTFVDTFLGKAAVAADALTKCGARQMRTRDFENVERVVRHYRPFSDEEMWAMDQDLEAEDDGSDFRPRVLINASTPKSRKR